MIDVPGSPDGPQVLAVATGSGGAPLRRVARAGSIVQHPKYGTGTVFVPPENGTVIDTA